ncbi:MAG TPA: PHB depolymerase family esterase [Candidatus Baltobacteraceae bacterium]|nr:PHB depolymerase family esterase [Candidatus Baltobacteraceae bacterium]
MLIAALSVTLHLLSGGLDRTYHFYRPPVVRQSDRAPLVVVLHGGYGTGMQAEKDYGWDELAQRGRFLVAYPDGVGRSWSAGLCCGPAKKRNIDDVAFIGAMVAAIERTQNADPRRVYVTGMSNGAMMAYRLACEAPFPIAAVGSVAGTLDTDSCPHPQRTAVMEIHGLNDEHVPFNGGVGVNHPQPQPFRSVAATLAVWQKANACGEPFVSRNGVTNVERWTCSRGGHVELVSIANAGHEWPGSRKGPRGALLGALLHIAPADPVSDALDATQALWDFFTQR